MDIEVKNIVVTDDMLNDCAFDITNLAIQKFLAVDEFTIEHARSFRSDVLNIIKENLGIYD